MNYGSSTLIYGATAFRVSHTPEQPRRFSNRTWLVHPDPGSGPGQAGNWFGTWYDALSRPYYLHANYTTGIAYTYFYPHGAPSILDRPQLAPTYFNYDAIQRVSRIVHTYAGSIGTVDWTWTRNPAGQIATMSRDNDAYAWTGAYNVSRAYAANGLNQYLTAGGVGFGYDANGNLTSDGSNAYVYDVENRLVAASGAHNAGLAYDPLGRLWQVSAAGVTTTFLYDGNALVAEYNGATLLRRHVHNVGADVPLITYEGTGLTNPRWLHANHQGSIVAHSNASGATAAINAYDEWGIPNAANVGRFQYTGQAWISEFGMYHYKARIYSPTLGRFLQTDPVGYDDQINLYAYVGNDPVNGGDPSGMQGCSDVGTNTPGGGNQTGLAGGCENAAAYRPGKDGSINSVSTPQIDQSARVNMPSIEHNACCEENLAQFDQEGDNVTFTPLHTTTSNNPNTSQGRATPIGSPEAVGHSQYDLTPPSGSPTQNLAPGFENRTRGDHLQVNAGRPNYIINRGIVIVIERSQGQFRARVISGTPSSIQLRQIRTQLNILQRGSR